MKNSIILLLLFPVLFFSQVENFTANNRQLSWGKIYETSLSKNDLINILKSSGKFSITSEDDNSIFGSTKNIMADYKGAGFTTMGTTIYVQNSSIGSNFKIDFKENKYRVTINNIILTELVSPIGSFLKTQDPNIALEMYVLKNGKDEFRGTFEKRDAKIFNYTFTNLFDFSKYKKSPDNW